MEPDRCSITSKASGERLALGKTLAALCRRGSEYAAGGGRTITFTRHRRKRRVAETTCSRPLQHLRLVDRSPIITNFDPSTQGRLSGSRIQPSWPMVCRAKREGDSSPRDMGNFDPVRQPFDPEISEISPCLSSQSSTQRTQPRRKKPTANAGFRTLNDSIR